MSEAWFCPVIPRSVDCECYRGEKSCLNKAPFSIKKNRLTSGVRACVCADSSLKPFFVPLLLRFTTLTVKSTAVESQDGTRFTLGRLVK